MSYSHVALPDLVVANGGTTSNTLRSDMQYADAEKIGIIAPAGATAGTIQVSHDGTTFVPLHDGLADTASPAATKARVYEIPFPFFRIACAATGAEIRYKTFKRILTT